MGDLRVRTTTGAEAVVEDAAVRAFMESLRGELLCPGDSGYDRARRIWNGMIDRHPAMIAQCAGVGDVISAVNFARSTGLLVAVRGGGHNVAGNAVCDGGIMIDLSRMKSVRVDPVHRTARAEPGLTWAEFDRETQVFGLAVTGGAISTTGIAGVTMGGGWGWLARRYGLASDNLLSVDMVTADGHFLTASATQNEDLFWGVRGGGGNFGVATSFEYRLHPVGKLLAGMLIYPFAKAKEVLRLYREFTRTEPEEVTTSAVILIPPGGETVAAIAVCYNGPIEQGERVLRPLREFGPPLADQVGPMSYTQVQKMLDFFYPPDIQNYWKSSFLKELSDDAIEVIVSYFSHLPLPSPMCHMVMEELGGAVSRRGQEETAFNHRDVRYNFLSLGVCTDPAESEKCIEWARKFWEAMQPFSSGGVYVNYLGQESAERVRAAYGAKKYERLVALKNKYDPTNLFRLNQNIKPTTAVSVIASGH